MAGERAGLVAGALHEVAVAAEDEGAVVDGLEAAVGGVDARREHPLREGHADGRGEALAERTCRRLDAGRVAVFGMAGGEAAELAELADVVERDAVAGKVEQTVEEHAAVAAGEDEAVAVRPRRILRVVLEVLEPEDRRDVREAHGEAGVARLRGLDGVN